MRDDRKNRMSMRMIKKRGDNNRIGKVEERRQSYKETKKKYSSHIYFKRALNAAKSVCDFL